MAHKKPIMWGIAKHHLILYLHDPIEQGNYSQWRVADILLHDDASSYGEYLEACTHINVEAVTRDTWDHVILNPDL